MIGHLTTYPPSLGVHLVCWYKWLWKGEGLDGAIHVESCIIWSSFSCTYTRKGERKGRGRGREGGREGGGGGGGGERVVKGGRKGGGEKGREGGREETPSTEHGIKC